MDNQNQTALEKDIEKSNSILQRNSVLITQVDGSDLDSIFSFSFDFDKLKKILNTLQISSQLHQRSIIDINQEISVQHDKDKQLEDFNHEIQGRMDTNDQLRSQMAQRVDQVLQRFQNFEKSTAADLQATLNKVSDLQEQFTIQQQQMILGGNSGISQTNSGQNGNIDQSKLKEMVINIIKEGQVMLRRPSTLAGTVGVLAAANAFKSQLTKKTSMNFNENSTQSFKNNSKDGEFIEDIEMELDDIKDQIQEMRDAIELIKEKDKNGQTKAFESQMQDLKKEMVSQQQKMEESISKLGTAQSYIKKQVQEQNPKEEIEGMNKRLRTMFNEIDELKLLHDRIYHVARRVENALQLTYL